jgi:hypothetical protein
MQGKQNTRVQGFRPKIHAKNYQIFLSFNIRYKNIVVKKIK